MNSQRDLFGDESVVEFELLNGGDGEDKGEEESGSTQEVQANDYDPKTKSTKAFKSGELAIIIDHMEENLEVLTGFCKDHEYKRVRNNAWAQLVHDINHWNQQNGTGVIRSRTSIRDKINNLKSRSKLM